MRLLLDTHTLLWYVLDDPQLSKTATTIILDPTNEVFISTVSLWEIAIKVSIKKLSLQRPYDEFLDKCLTEYQFELQPIEPRHLIHVSALAFLNNHRDPFDRLLVAQTLEEGFSIVSNDTALDGYGVNRIW
ncbi:MAG: type II toxin-antitoxin system VapC family toxin [Gemmatales bacterium]